MDELMLKIEKALTKFRQGQILILTDHESREHEGDLVLAADKVSPSAINFMLKYARGLLCLTLDEKIMDRLQIPLMPTRHHTENQAAFGMSIDAVKGISTGTSTADRARTIQVAINSSSTPDDIAIPGHVFPLRAKSDGVLIRAGHTEGSVDLAKLAGLTPAALICEVLNDDGTMARSSQLQQFAKLHNLELLAIEDIIQYRLAIEKINHNQFSLLESKV